MVFDYLRRRVLLGTVRLQNAPHTILLIANTLDRSADEFAAALRKVEYKVSSLFLENAVWPEEEARIARLAGQADVAIVLYTPSADAWARMVLGKLYTISAARDDRRPNIRAILPRDNTVLEGFGAPYCNLVLTSGPDTWEQVISELHMQIGRTPSI